MTANRFSTIRFLLTCVIATGAGACVTPERFVDTPQKRGELIEGLQTGPWTYFYPSGQIMAEGEYILDRQTGLWTYYHENGNEEWQGIFKNLALDGPSSTWYANGNNRTHGYFLAGDETGPWSFWNSAGELKQTGTYLQGKRAMRWAQYHKDGTVKSEGHFFNDRTMGVWKFWDESGALTAKTFPMPPGVELYKDQWPGGNVRREGFLLKGKPHGIWLTWHADGTLRMQGEFQRGVPTGRWQAWEVDGSPLALGEFTDGQPARDWTVWIDQQPTQVAAAAFVTAPETTEYSEDGMSAWFPPTEVLPIWIAEMLLPAVPAPAVELNAPEPSAGQLIAAGRRPRIPIRQQPWTVDEEQNIDTLVSLYSTKTQRRRGGGGRYASLARGQRRGDVASAEKRMGRPLPVTELLSGDDERLDLKQFRGEREVLLVILRGYAGYVCAYCAAQTKALRDHFEEFEALNTEVIVVYPGNRDRLEAFLQSYASLVDEEGDLPFTVAYDQDFQLVDSLDLRSDLALPTTLLIDKDGIVQYAYIGTDKTDRPSAETLLEAIKRPR